MKELMWMVSKPVYEMLGTFSRTSSTVKAYSLLDKLGRVMGCERNADGMACEILFLSVAKQ